MLLVASELREDARSGRGSPSRAATAPDSYSCSFAGNMGNTAGRARDSEHEDSASFQEEQ